jgi:aminocarboxymuconate-semialdehyde decarboxylase
MTTVDVHTHFLPLAWPDWAQKYGGDAPWPWMRPNEGGNPQRAMLMQGIAEFRPVHYACWDVPKRLADMAADDAPRPFCFSGTGARADVRIIRN